MHNFVIILVFVATLKTGIAIDCKNEPRCPISKVFGMRAADCSNKNFKQFPQCIRSDVEVIDLAMNRIRKLRYSDLERYRDLKALYLQDNTLAQIDEDAFNGLDDLTGLDLSFAAHVKIPEKIYHLPNLQTLYLSQHINSNIVESLEAAKPITCPLTHLDVSFSELERLPEMGLLPTLVKYNISGNNLMELGVKHFSGLCRLKYLVTENVSLNLLNPCQCWDTNRWLISKGMTFTPFDCQLKENLCDEVPFNITDIQIYEQCMELHKEITRRSLLKKVVIPTVVAVIIILCIFFYCKRRRRRNIKPPYLVPMEEESANTLPLKQGKN